MFYTYLSHLDELFIDIPAVVSGGGVGDDDESVRHVGSVSGFCRKHTFPYVLQHVDQVEACRAHILLVQSAQSFHNTLRRVKSETGIGIQKNQLIISKHVVRRVKFEIGIGFSQNFLQGNLSCTNTPNLQ